MDRVFKEMSEDPEMGPRLRAADVPRRFEFTDLAMVLNVRAGRGEERENLHWVWSDEIDWSPKVRMVMSSETANRYFLGRENFMFALMRRRIKTSGDLQAAIELIPITKEIPKRYRRLLERDYPHLLA
jgi:hypothetical protein